MRLREGAHDLATFCLATGVQPSEYYALTRLERDEFVKLVNSRPC